MFPGLRVSTPEVVSKKADRVIFLDSNILGYVVLQGSDEDVDREARRFVAVGLECGSTASLFERHRKEGAFTRADLIQIMNTAPIGCLQDYADKRWRYFPSDPRNHPELLRYYKKFKPCTFLELLIRGYPEAFSEKELVEEIGSMPRNVLEFILMYRQKGFINETVRFLRSEIKNVSVQTFIDKEVCGLTGGVVNNRAPLRLILDEMNEHDIEVNACFHAKLERYGLFDHKCRDYTAFFDPANADRYSTVNQKTAALIVAKAFQSTLPRRRSAPGGSSPPKSKLSVVPDIDAAPSVVAHILEYVLYYGSDIDVLGTLRDLAENQEVLHLFTKNPITVFSTGRELEISSTTNRRKLRAFLENACSGVLLEFMRQNSGGLWHWRSSPFAAQLFLLPIEGLEKHHALASYYRRCFPHLYFDLIAVSSTVSGYSSGVCIRDEIDAICPANVIEYFIRFGSKHDIVSLYINMLQTEIIAQACLRYVDKKNWTTFTRENLRLIVGDLTASGFDLNGIPWTQSLVKFPQVNLPAAFEFFIKYSCLKRKNGVVWLFNSLYPGYEPVLIDIIPPPPYSDEQLRGVLSCLFEVCPEVSLKKMWLTKI
jgi:hypothetical protein